MGLPSVALRLRQIDSLRGLTGSSKPQDFARALQKMEETFNANFREIARLLENMSVVADSFVKEGRGEGALLEGMLCYQAGSVWRPAVASSATKWAHGAVFSKDGERVKVIRRGLCVVKAAIATISAGQTVWLSAVEGAVTNARPDPMVAAVIQEIGKAEGSVYKGQVPIDLHYRLEPETTGL